MNADNNKDLMSEINITPFVDVMLVLLIIFMVTAPMMQRGIDIDLPATTAKGIAPQPEHIVLSIDKNKTLYINEAKVTIDSLQEKLEHIMFNKKIKEVYLKADKNVEYGEVVKVMAEVKEAGVDKIGMVTDPLHIDEKK